MRVPPVAALVVAFSACWPTGSIQSGEMYYQSGRFEDAKRELESVDGRQGDMTAREQVRYLACRGLTYHHLGERARARGFLEKARAQYRRGPKNWLDPNTVDELDRALDGP